MLKCHTTNSATANGPSGTDENECEHSDATRILAPKVRYRRSSNSELPRHVASKIERKNKRYTRCRPFFWKGLTSHWWTHIIPVDLTVLWRRHLVWSKDDGKDLLQIVTTRFTGTTVFLSLLVTAELGVLFSPSAIVEQVRESLVYHRVESLKFWTGMVLCISILASVSALISNFTAWSIFIVLSAENAALILRSSIGLYAAQMPNRLVVASMYLFLAWIIMFLWILLPLAAVLPVTVVTGLQLSHIASTYSAVGQVIMSTGAMSSTRVLPKGDEEALAPDALYAVLLTETQLAQKASVPVNMQYRMNYREYIRRNYKWPEHMDEDEIVATSPELLASTNL